MKYKIRGMWKSWTIRVNTLFAMLLGGLPMLQDSLPALQPYVGAEAYKWAMGGVIISNILLRFKTSSGLEHK